MIKYQRLDEICNIVMGQSPDSKSYNYEGLGLPFFQGNADFGDMYPTKRVWCTLPTKVVEADTLLISVRAPIGALNFSNEPSCIGRGLAGIVPKDSINLKYVYYCLKHKNTELNSKGTGSTFKAISKSALAEVIIKIVSTDRQAKIVTTLDNVTQMIKFRKQQLEQLDLLIQSRFVEMFGDPELNSKNWNEFALKEYLNIVGGYAFKSELFKEKGIPVLRIGNINSGHFQSVNMVYWEYDTALERYLLRSGDIVMSLTGTVGKNDYGNVCILGNEYDLYYLNQRNAKLELGNGINKYYLANLLKFTTIKKRLTGISRGVRQANISNKDILNLVVPIPPIELQKKFAKFVEQVEKSKSAVQKALDEVQLLFDSLTQEYFG